MPTRTFIFAALLALMANGCASIVIGPSTPVEVDAEQAVADAAFRIETDVRSIGDGSNVTISIGSPDAGTDATAVTDTPPSADVTSSTDVLEPGPEVETVTNDRGTFWFCQPYGGGTTSIYGYASCCTSGRWFSLDDVAGRVHGHMLLRDPSTGQIYFTYGRTDGTLARALVPTMPILNSWYHPASIKGNALNTRDPNVCLNVTGVTTDILAMIPLIGRVTYRAGSTFFRLVEDPQVYTVSGGRTLRTLRSLGPDVTAVPEGWLPEPLLQFIPPELLSAGDYTDHGDVIYVESVVDGATMLQSFTAPTEQIDSYLR